MLAFLPDTFHNMHWVNKGTSRFVANLELKQPIFVEFVGAAGAGKSFIATRLCDELNRRGIKARDLVNIRIDKGKLRNYLTVAYASVSASRILPRNLLLHKTNVKRLAKLSIRRKSVDPNTEAMICDEGIFQIIRALYRNSRATSMIEVSDKLRGFVDMPDIVVGVDATVDTVFARRTKRDRPGDQFDRQSVTRDVSMIEDTVAVVRHVQGFSEYDLSYLLVDVNGSNFQTIVEELATVVETRISNHASKTTAGLRLN